LEIWRALETLTDPEIPVVSLREMGILRDVRGDASQGYEVVITPTYSGCPAMEQIHDDVLATMQQLGHNVSVVTRLTLMQLETPNDMRGRVAAVNSIFIGASNQLGEFESGATAALLGPVGSVVMGGVGTMLVAVTWLKLFPELSRRDRLS
jgi:metal-sulfur cluster biosynthetic enzyme